MLHGALARVAVVDDEPDVRSMLSDYLSRDGYEVSSCASGAELDALVEKRSPDLVVLDVSMPDEDGISIARRLHAVNALPIIMVTGLGDVIDRVVGLEVGADDYLTKPVDLRELSARVRAVLRRAGDRPAPSPVRGPPANTDDLARMACFGEAWLDVEGRRLLDREGSPLPITACEFDLLATFARHPNTVLSRERLLGEAAEIGQAPCDRAIDIRMTRLRKRIEINPAKPRVIRTVRGAGYVYVPPA